VYHGVALAARRPASPGAATEIRFGSRQAAGIQAPAIIASLHKERQVDMLSPCAVAPVNWSGVVPPTCYLSAGIRRIHLINIRHTVNLGRALSVVWFGALIALSGCASIVSGRQADIAFDSVPSNAHVVIRDKAGRKVASLTTPGVVSVRRNRRFFMPARYTADIEAPGYLPARTPIRSTINPWVFGNVIIGGIPGLVVDTATGAAWKPRESQIHQQLTPLYGQQSGSYSSVDAARFDETRDAAAHVAEESSPSPVERR
jgi:hypothetical protein